jgi:hypothetical protein
MKTLLFFSFILFVILTACSSDDTPAPTSSNSSVSSFAGNWNFNMAGGSWGNAILYVDNDGGFEARPYLHYNATDSTKILFEGDISSNGSIPNGHINLSGTQVGTFTGTFSGSNASGNWTTSNYFGSGTWTANK